MIKLLAVFIFLRLAACQDEISQYFDDFNAIDTVEGLQCSKLGGTSNECLACYPCDHEKIKSVKKALKTLSLTYSNCTTERVCCVETSELSGRTSGGDCGKSNPQGDPPINRPSLRSVLEREYPWRAWVYWTNIEKPLCAATYIYFGVNALLTTASCVSGYQASDLNVKFTKTQSQPDIVTNVIIHENFIKRKGGNMNDIALLTIHRRPHWRVKFACLNNVPPVLASSCISVSDVETYINAIIPQKKKCEEEKVNIDTTMCTFMAKGDYTPQDGAGLYCLNEHFKTPAYTVNGLYQADQSTPSLAIYTSVHNYTNWILHNTNDIQKPKNRNK